ncbi:MAG TPA: aspartyl protease family protein [Candidatus Methylacidiphilales bacterium]|nr:aspartyl protease family protein [Candidatus Methylacidiphilales bacterium]
MDVIIAVSAPRYQALIDEKQPIPSPVTIRVLLDTGAGVTAIDAQVLNQLGITPRGVMPCHTPSTKDGAAHNLRVFDVGLGFIHIPNPPASLVFNPIPVVEAHLAHQGIQGLIGRDVLAKCLLTYNGQANTFSLAF